jgi:hypothetical protein
MKSQCACYRDVAIEETGKAVIAGAMDAVSGTTESLDSIARIAGSLDTICIATPYRSYTDSTAGNGPVPGSPGRSEDTHAAAVVNAGCTGVRARQTASEDAVELIAFSSDARLTHTVSVYSLSGLAGTPDTVSGVARARNTDSAGPLMIRLYHGGVCRFCRGNDCGTSRGNSKNRCVLAFRLGNNSGAGVGPGVL